MSLFGYSVPEMIDSLRACEQVIHSGGKSNASFFRTRDGRFLVKTISNAEMTFLAAFLPHYFAYILGEPESYLVRILAAFTVTVESEQVNYNHKCILMENLSAGFDDFETYDLKGSARNRWLESATVKLDTNYRRSRIEQRVVLTTPTKDGLMKQIARDSMFLAQHRVMDYSMLAIVARATRTVRLGIVDFCRPYTIDKALESMVKKTPLYRDHTLGDPTVISPAEYQRRFVDAMRDYFYVAPSYADTITYLARPPSAGR
jgi:1-phosphatidylinositol-3-phosphate 5-kinase